MPRPVETHASGSPGRARPLDALARAARERARAAGFQAVGITRPHPSEHGAFYRRWLGAGFHAGMSYLAREDAVHRREDPRRSFEAAGSPRARDTTSIPFSPPAADGCWRGRR